MSLRITAWGGVNEIGGNQILVEVGTRRILLDFGLPFGREGAYFNEYLKPRPTRGILDRIALGLLPPLRGLYRDDLLPVLLPDEELDALPLEGRQRKVRYRVRPRVEERFWRRFPHRDLRRDGPPVDALLLSHAHLDHVGLLGVLRREIPVYASTATALLCRVLQDTGQSGGAYLTPRRPTEHGLLRADSEAPRLGRPWRLAELGFAPPPPPEGVRAALEAHREALGASRRATRVDRTTGKRIPKDEEERRLDRAWVERTRQELARAYFARLGDFFHTDPNPQREVLPYDGPVPELPPGSLTAHPVDHSIPGALAWLLRTEEGILAYTGDLRFHGRRGRDSEALMEAWTREGVDVLLCEGTRLTPATDRAHGRHTEAEVAENALQILRRAPGRFAVADFSARHVERLLSFLAVAREAGRRLLLQPRDLYLLHALALTDEACRRALRDPYLALYDDPKATTYAWERLVRTLHEAVSPREVARDPGAWLLAVSLWDAADLVDLVYLMEDRPGGVYLYANSAAYDQEQAADLERLRRWVRFLGMEFWGDPDDPGTLPLHTSGHAPAADLIRFVREVRPRILIPIHTEHPHLWEEALKGTGVEIRYLRPGEAAEVG